MAKTTDIGLRNCMIYCVFVRNYGRVGNFQEVKKDLARIQDLGTDIIWFLPIHPIGQIGRKGMLGSPYAVRDYRAINPEYGTLNDFQQIVDEIHERGMKCMIDIVFDHTAKDSEMLRNHPQWFVQNSDGEPISRNPEWTDVVELDFSNLELWDELIEILKFWAGYVDGFRCNRAYAIPLEFWMRARKEVESVRKECIWLAQSGEGEDIMTLRAKGQTALSDGELYEVFDMCFDYDLAHSIRGLHEGRFPLDAVTNPLQMQESKYPNNYVKLHALEDHDRPRAAFNYPDRRVLENMTAFSFFAKGAVMISNGQEKSDPHRPSLFDKDDVSWRHNDMSAFIKQLKRIKSEEIFREGSFFVKAVKKEYIYATYEQGNKRCLGVFSIMGRIGTIPTTLEDGTYINRISRRSVEVCAGQLLFEGEPIIIDYQIG
ncbi:alpha-amylase family glycosyl hydrolase [Eubacterium oxidoreducens]|uniref:Glycosidase n=1 Tax=Eubacterium oxidoreducens TaxID=1732 RepID=A0A1G6CJC8_EUBOX|nr:alpha-amylase family glycosyl hydrolase [Eubacterium oxidoreducens]SDB32845.1 Glycosidase [Eubacterium oxidoreducens]